jgi:hypothetical protein
VPVCSTVWAVPVEDSIVCAGDLDTDLARKKPVLGRPVTIRQAVALTVAIYLIIVSVTMDEVLTGDFVPL